MTASKDYDAELLGYLAFVETAHGIVGGYLLVNQHARPIEFHCSAPLRPNRAQQILYGPTLRPFLYAEHIGQTLVRQSKATSILLTDEQQALGLSRLVEMPIVLLDASSDEAITSDARLRANETASFCADEDALILPAGFNQQRSSVMARLCQMHSVWDLREPLSRIREAIHEAQRAAA